MTSVEAITERNTYIVIYIEGAKLPRLRYIKQLISQQHPGQKWSIYDPKGAIPSGFIHDNNLKINRFEPWLQSIPKVTEWIIVTDKVINNDLIGWYISKLQISENDPGQKVTFFGPISIRLWAEVVVRWNQMGFTVWKALLTIHKLIPNRDRINMHRNYLARITLDSSRENDRRETSLHEELAVMRKQFSQALYKHHQTPFYQYMTPHQAAWNGILEKFLRTHPSATVMDAGCGSNFLGRFGNLVEKFPQATFWAVDISEDVIRGLRQQCQDKHTVYPIVAPLNNLQDIPTHSVDIIIFTDVFEHLNNPTKVLYELKR